MVTIKQIADIMEEIAPAALAYDWDNVGLLLGDMAAEARGIVVALDATDEAVDAALSLGANLLITHHPLWLGGATRLTVDGGDGSILLRMARAGMHLFAAHTNLDVAQGGVNDALANAVGVLCAAPLQAQPERPMVKLTVYVPKDRADAVREALGFAGAGRVGNYSHCSFAAPGVGQFLPQEGATPAVGEVGALTQVDELRLEAILPRHRQGQVIAAMLRAHPYETPAWDITAVDVGQGAYGLGRIGNLAAPVSLRDYAATLVQALGCDTMQLVGDPGRVISRVAVCGGSGGSVLRDAKACGADVLVTGEVKHHETLWAKQNGIAIAIAGHDCTERVVVPVLANQLRCRLCAAGGDLSVRPIALTRAVWRQA